MWQVLIVGGGPAALSAAIYCARACLRTLVATAAVGPYDSSGGQLMRTSEVFNYPGFPEGIEGPQLIEKFKLQASQVGATFVDHWVSNFRFSSTGKHAVL
jgi:thioredoxin reductase (NADPH)